MSSSSAHVGNTPQNGQFDLDSDRRRWFGELDALKGRFEAEREHIKAKYRQSQQDACNDLDDEARVADMDGVPYRARELIQKYQNELRTHRYAKCQHEYEAAEKELAKREKDMLRDHHMKFPLPSSSAQYPSPAMNSAHLGRNPCNASGHLPNGRVASTPEILGRGSPSRPMPNTLPPPRQPLPQGAGMPAPPAQPNQTASSSRLTSTGSVDVSSAPMPSHNHANHANHQSHATQNHQAQSHQAQSHQAQSHQAQSHQAQNHQNQNWTAHNQPGAHQASSNMSSFYNQNRPTSNSAGQLSRMLPSHGNPRVLGSNQFGQMRSGAGQTGIPDFHRGNRMPLPPLNQTTLNGRDDRQPANFARNASQYPGPRLEDAARRATEIDLERQRLTKRKSDATESLSRDGDAKRPRSGSPRSIAPKTITFKEVYQDGKAEFKHNIIKFDEVFYILKCDEHGVHFKQNALAAAAKHLHGASHGHQKKEHRLAVETIGFHVVDCTDELAAMNNRVVQAAFENGYKPLNQLHGPKSGGKRHSGGTLLTELPTEREPSASEVSPREQSHANEQQEAKQQEPVKYITNPKAGEIYDAKWPKSSKIYTIMVLGWTSLKQCGWDCNLSDTPLYEKKVRPSCYIYNDEGIAGWAPGFGDGEPKVSERDIPVIWYEPKGKTRLGWLGVKWLLKPMLLDDPDRPADPEHPANVARAKYADIRGFNSFEDMLAGVKRQSPAATSAGSAEVAAVPAKLPSSASASDSDSSPDVDMYDFGDNPPVGDDSEDEDYVEMGGNGKHSDDDMADDDDGARPTTPQPLRRSTQEVRPTSRLGESGWGSGRIGAAAGTRASAKKDKTTIDREDVAMPDAPRVTPSKSRAGHQEATPKNDKEDGGSVPNVALGTPATPNKSSDDDTNAPADTMQAPPARAASNSSTSIVSAGSPEPRSEHSILSEMARAATDHARISREQALDELKRDSAAETMDGSRSGNAEATAQERETPRVSPKVQVTDLLNSTSSGETTRASKPDNARRQPLPSRPSSSDSNEAAPLRRPLPSKPTSLHVTANDRRTDVGQQPSPALSVRSNKEAEVRSGSVDSMARRSDPRMSINNALDDGARETGRQGAEGAMAEKDQEPTTSNGISSGNSTPRLLSQANLANDDRWKAVRASQSPHTTSASIDRSAATSPALSIKNTTEELIDVLSFREGDKRWVQTAPDKFLRFHMVNDERGIAQTSKEDGIEATIDPSRVKAAQMVGSTPTTATVRLMLKSNNGTASEQEFVFGNNKVTGSHRGARMQAQKFYRFVASKNPDIEHAV
ncbi:hypothetical protein CCHL11_07142 [Colletotrichum chlorophyti]|uniref:Uncharacterized protein n=1 Tax=Colletotrichum chlorophyti TaxID=708187 RepID=A0A1Q8S0K2_9PEZI|nr:hypothetical protein CCHL11_07142 [Colletotrichum chlorophyti]